MSIYVGIPGYSHIQILPNLVTNGKLSSSSGWTTNSYFNYSYSNGYLDLTVKTASSGTTLRPTYQSLSISGSTANTNQILYAQASVSGSDYTSDTDWPIVYLRRTWNGGSSNYQVYLQPYNATALNNGYFRNISLRTSTYVDSSNYYDYNRICFSIKPPLVVNSSYHCFFRKIILVNLTDAFGRGNEPSKEWCDEHIYMNNDGEVVCDVSSTKYIPNMLLNGELTNSTKGWKTSTNYYTYNTSTEGTKMTISTAAPDTNTWYTTYQDFYPSVTGSTSETRQLIYVSAKVKGKTTNVNEPIVMCRYYADGGDTVSWVKLDLQDEGTINDGNWHLLGRQYQTYNSSTDHYFELLGTRFGIKPTTNVGDEMTVKDVFAVNLTDAFGRGNEPDVNWCAANMSLQSVTGRNYRVVCPALDADSSFARKVDHLFVGVNNVARKVKKAYIGINNVARKFFGPILKYLGTTTSTLSSYKCDLASAVTGNYALFAGGLYAYYNDGYSSIAVNTVDAYDNTLIKSTPSNLATQVEGLAGVSFNNYALFGGGKSNATLYPIQTTVNVYNNSLSKLTSVELSTRRHYLNSGKIGNYALFAGGYYVTLSSNTYLNSVDAFNTSLVLIDPAPDSLSEKKCSFATAQSSNYLLFAGGKNSNLLSTVDAYNTSLVKTTCTNLSVGRPLLAGTAIDNIYLFAGGGNSSQGATSVIDVYNSLVKTDSLSLSVARYDLTGVVIDEYIIFAGGATFTSSGSKRYTYASDVVDVFNKQLISISGYSLSSVKAGLKSAALGNYALLAGGTRTINDGYDSGGYYSSNTVDVFQAYY